MNSTAVNPSDGANVAWRPAAAGLIPLSFSEELMWQVDRTPRLGAPFLDCASNLLIGASIRGHVDTPALMRSVATILERHDVLRSTIHEVAGMPYRRVGVAAECQVVDLRDRHDASGAGVARLLRDEVNTPIDLATGPLCRTLLLRTSDAGHVFACIVHHLVFDGWSRGIFARELKSLYAAYSAGRNHDLPPLPIRHADYVNWQRSRFSEGGVHGPAKAMAERLTHPPVPTVVEPGRGDTRTDGTRRAFLLEEPHIDTLRIASRVHGVTLAVLVLAIFVTVVRQVMRLDDVLVGVPTSERRRPAFQALIGLFVDVVVARIEGRHDESLADAVRHVRESLRKAYAAQLAVPYGRFMHWKRDHGVTVPEYPFLFSFHNDPPNAAIALDGAASEDLGVMGGRHRTLADVALLIAPVPSGLQCILSARSGSAAAAYADRLVHEFRALVSSAGDARERSA